MTRRAMRRAVGACPALLAAATVMLVMSGCSSVEGSAGPAPGEAAAYRSDVSTARQANSARAAAELCATSTTSMVVMLRGYNAFIARLNDVQSYDKVGDLGDKARAALIAGTDMVRPKRTADVPGDLGTVVGSFVDSSNALGDVIGRRQTVELNVASNRWTASRRAVLDACRAYLPPPPATSVTPGPQSASESQPSTTTSPPTG
ncbi:hypothetical protein [Gordonia aichiensis]|nr:hypothetical protein [Gordonia aichiensis]